jgi:hypothetical protein
MEKLDIKLCNLSYLISMVLSSLSISHFIHLHNSKIPFSSFLKWKCFLSLFLISFFYNLSPFISFLLNINLWIYYFLSHASFMGNLNKLWNFYRPAIIKLVLLQPKFKKRINVFFYFEILFFWPSQKAPINLKTLTQ